MFWETKLLGRGIATHAVNHISYANLILGLRKVYAGVAEHNASIKVLKKNGFTEEARREDHLLYNETRMAQIDFKLIFTNFRFIFQMFTGYSGSSVPFLRGALHNRQLRPFLVKHGTISSLPDSLNCDYSLEMPRSNFGPNTQTVIRMGMRCPFKPFQYRPTFVKGKSFRNIANSENNFLLIMSGFGEISQCPIPNLE